MHVYKGQAAKTLDYITVFFFKSEDYWPENHVEITMKMLNRDPEIKTICSTVQATISSPQLGPLSQMR